MSAAVLAPFDLLARYEARSLAHVAGAPEQIDSPGLWRGIGFRVGNDRFVSSIAEVTEILTMPPLTPVPGARRWLLGLANVRGNLVPVIDMRDLVGGGRTATSEASRVLLIRQGGGSAGLLVDEVLGQRSFVDEQIGPEVEVTDGFQAYVEGGVALGGETWHLFNMAALTASPAFRQAAA